MQSTMSLKAFTPAQVGAAPRRSPITIVRCEQRAVEGLKAAAKNAALAACAAALLLSPAAPAQANKQFRAQQGYVAELQSSIKTRTGGLPAVTSRPKEESYTKSTTPTLSLSGFRQTQIGALPASVPTPDPAAPAKFAAPEPAPVAP